jgi:hypothetical protein
MYTIRVDNREKANLTSFSSKQKQSTSVGDYAQSTGNPTAVITDNFNCRQQKGLLNNTNGPTTKIILAFQIHEHTHVMTMMIMSMR